MKQTTKFRVGNKILCRHCNTMQKIVSITKPQEGLEVAEFACGFRLPIVSIEVLKSGTLVLDSIPPNSEVVLRDLQNNPVLEVRNFEQPSHDFPSGVINTQMANRRTRRWKHIIKSKKTGEVVHYEDEPLSEHIQHKR